MYRLYFKYRHIYNLTLFLDVKNRMFYWLANEIAKVLGYESSTKLIKFSIKPVLKVRDIDPSQKCLFFVLNYNQVIHIMRCCDKKNAYLNAFFLKLYNSKIKLRLDNEIHFFVFQIKTRARYGVKYGFTIWELMDYLVCSTPTVTSIMPSDCSLEIQFTDESPPPSIQRKNVIIRPGQSLVFKIMNFSNKKHFLVMKNIPDKIQNSV